MTLNPHTKDFVQRIGTTPKAEEETARLDLLPNIAASPEKADPCQSVNIDRMKTDHLRITVDKVVEN